MLVYNVITVICLVLMLLTTAIFVISFFAQKGRAERINFIRNFKKGKGIVIYFFAIPLYWIGIVFSGETVFEAFFSSIKNLIDLIVLQYDIVPIQALINANQLYKFTIYLCFVLICLNALLLGISIASQYFWLFVKKTHYTFSGKEKLTVFGNNEQNYLIYNSEKNRVKVIVDKFSSEDGLPLYTNNIFYENVSSYQTFIEKLVNKCSKKRDKHIVVINTGDDEKNIEISRIFIDAITMPDINDRFLKNKESIAQEYLNNCFDFLKIFVFGNPKYEAIYEDIVGDGKGCITYINKYQKIAIDFIDNYPFSKFLTKEHIDFNTSLMKNGVDVNAFLIGFGRTNQQIFLTSVANNQFITKINEEIKLKKVRYFIFDKNPSENNKNLNHNYNRYKNECVNLLKKDYLPLPDYPAEEHFFHLDINDMNFYNEIHKIAKKKTKSLNFIIIAFGSDLENIDMAHKLIFKFREWNIKNINIFVKVRGEHEGQHLLEEANCYIIGKENKVIYSIDNIVNGSFYKMAQMRNEVYDIEYQLTNSSEHFISDEKIVELKEKAYNNWFKKKSQMERDSSLYACLSIRSKLHMMGLDYCNADDNLDKYAITYQEYLNIYAKNDKPNVDYYPILADGKPIVHYMLDFKNGRRKNLAIHEHLRWNSFMISKGIVPASKNQILNEVINCSYTNGKNYDMRRHGNITTFEGLEEFRKMLATREFAMPNNKKTLEEIETSLDVIKYDYQLLDDVYWLLTKNGYKIITRDV